jgi:hypothetical protein
MTSELKRAKKHRHLLDVCELAMCRKEEQTLCTKYIEDLEENFTLFSQQQ